MKFTEADVQDCLHLLQETPCRIAAISKGAGTRRLESRPDKKSWSANDILAHIRSCADVWGDSIREMLVRDMPTIKYTSPRTWIRKTDYPQLDFHTSLAVFTAQREELLGELRPLPFTDWSRSAMIKGRQETVFSYARRMALHELGHLDQFEQVLGGK